MDWSKYPLDKVLHYAAGIIPGLVALFVIEVIATGSFARFFNLGFLGYRTKIGLILLLAFVIGNTLSVCLGFILVVPLAAMGATTYAIRSRSSYEARHPCDAAP